MVTKRQRVYRRRQRIMRILVVICIAIVATISMEHMHLFPKENKQKSVQPVVEKKKESKPKKVVEEKSANPWNLILVNKTHPLPENHKAQLVKLKNGESVDKRISDSLQKMFESARKQGIYPVVVSGYRNIEAQKDIMSKKVAQYQQQGYKLDDAKTKANMEVALPRTSEHESGLAVDINSDGIHTDGKQVYNWLNQNSYKFGFIHRYPENKTKITGVINEPWHYRYVGIEAATEIYNRGICLEEYLNAVN